VIENTIFQSFFVEHYKDPNLLAAADGKEAQLRDLSAISSQILSFLFTGK